MPHFFFFFNDTATTEIYTLSLHDALPILSYARHGELGHVAQRDPADRLLGGAEDLRRPLREVEAERGTEDRKSTRLNSSHSQISYAVFCLKKKRQILQHSWKPVLRRLSNR